MIPDILIPTCKPAEAVYHQVCDCSTWSPGLSVIATTQPGLSAARNRNLAISMAHSELVVMIDDDIAGFHFEWWKKMIEPLILDRDVVLVSARLMKPDGSDGYMTGECYDKWSDVVDVPAREVPSACIAFRLDGTTFDEGYLGSGFEDNDFCRQLTAKYPNSRIVIANNCRMIHLNEMKNQSSFDVHNRALFNKKWGTQR